MDRSARHSTGVALALGVAALSLALVASVIPLLLPSGSRVFADDKSAAPSGCRIALLVGAGFKQKKDVTGPAPAGPREWLIATNSTDAVAGPLTDNWGFATGDVQTLLNLKAKKAAVMKAFGSLMDKIDAKAAKDCASFYVDVYIQGHGRAWFDGSGTAHWFVRMGDNVAKDGSGFYFPLMHEDGSPDLTDQITKLSSALTNKKFANSHLIVQVDSCFSEGMFLDLLKKPLPTNVSISWSAAKSGCIEVKADDKSLKTDWSKGFENPFLSTDTSSDAAVYSSTAQVSVEDALKSATSKAGPGAGYKPNPQNPAVSLSNPPAPAPAKK